ncbi:hypothetical protein RvY_19217 [Ramazzottius varieornatus]|uniref:Uncharacterized protein n=1 Tax=Ramazzottius varieornatus TaxID=947166 RepID=A0A1D1WAR6_RAMVA|nr:hypothetical protein RvY_19217 [Ramazzottius varieornatus]
MSTLMFRTRKMKASCAWSTRIVHLRSQKEKENLLAGLLTLLTAVIPSLAPTSFFAPAFLHRELFYLVIHFVRPWTVIEKQAGYGEVLSCRQGGKEYALAQLQISPSSSRREIL